MTFCLDSILIRPENSAELKNAIILLHGYGGDGKDISALAINWQRLLAWIMLVSHGPLVLNLIHLGLVMKFLHSISEEGKLFQDGMMAARE